MSLGDVFVIVIMLLSGVIALRFGFIRVVLGLAGWVGATLATIYFYPVAQTYAQNLIENQLLADIAAGATIFVSSMIILSLLANAIARGIRHSGLDILDRTFGLVVGLVIGAAIVSGTYIFTNQVFGLNDKSSFFADARTLPLLRRAAGLLVSATPEEWGIVVPKNKEISPNQTFKTLLSPQPKKTSPDLKSGYKVEERRDMDRLIRSQQK
ncbi:MAG: hypothetical protein CMM58_12505 [Rhodospirillaceae bacterium]|nr:hypothetical protein [Rhodospirillaceae bacterium]|tara:strand:- start:204 stop:836 length:633 start_codon:yes stop_codon:yes gene_type:complete